MNKTFTVRPSLNRRKKGVPKNNSWRHNEIYETAEFFAVFGGGSLIKAAYIKKKAYIILSSFRHKFLSGLLYGATEPS